MSKLKAGSIDHIKWFRDFYNRNGATVIICSKCNKIKDIKYPERSFSGPSISSNMFCNCNLKMEIQYEQSE